MKRLIYSMMALTIMAGCNNGGGKRVVKEHQVAKTIIVPDFNADSAYHYVAEQVAFGPRVPETEAHKQCALYLEQTLKRFTPDVMVQRAEVRAYDNTILNISNIIASFNPNQANRVMLCAHWDSRPYADHDPDASLHNTPIDGANDGASGVGVLMEVARALHATKPDIGVDIILFDAEDYGEPQSMQSDKEDTWALGSQYWSKNPHVSGYAARYGILLDMVGVKNATFTLEGTSMYYAKDVMNKVWDVANDLGYGDYFRYEHTNPILDDHYYINQYAFIPTIDIIHHDENTESGFYAHWHTINDNMEQVSRESLRVTGHTLLELIYHER